MTYMVEMFGGCTSFNSDLSLWNVSSVTDMNSCFRGCTSLTQAPEIPSSVIYMGDCFRDCTSLTQAPEIPFGVTYMSGCFYGCTSLTQASEIPSSVLDMSYCFASCALLVQSPTISSNVTNIGGCFRDCASLVQAPEIPSSVTHMGYCFYGCVALTGSIKISSTALNMNNCFTNTSNPIYLINNTSPKDAIITSNLRDVASEYSNVYYEADSNLAPTIFGKTLRVISPNSETEGEGTYAFIMITTTLYNSNLPVGWTVELGSINLKVDDIDTPIAWQDTRKNLTCTSKTWYNTNDLVEHSFAISVTDIIRDENKQIVAQHQSNLTTLILLKAPAIPFSVFHNKENNTDGVAVGILATKGELLEIDWNTQFNRDMYFTLDTESEIDKKIYDALITFGWDTGDDSVII